MKNKLRNVIILAAMAIGLIWACKHEPEVIDTGPDPNPNPTDSCDTANVTYAGSVYPIFEQYCTFCHGGAIPEAGIDLTSYEDVAMVAQSGQLLGAINHDANYSPMPKDGNKLSVCQIRTITIWVNDTTFEEPGHPCDPDTIYFERDLLPILQSTCGQPGCHDALTAQEGIRITDYASIMNSDIVVPGNPGNSEMYEVITETDPDKRMPPPPAPAMPQEYIAMVNKWISQGAQNLFCDDEECDTTSVTYTTPVSGIIQKHCLGCHNDNNMLGGLSLQGYSKVVAVANDGRLLGVVRHENGYPAMPKNQDKLSDCKIRQLEIWIENGTPQ